MADRIHRIGIKAPITQVYALLSRPRALPVVDKGH